VLEEFDIEDPDMGYEVQLVKDIEEELGVTRKKLALMMGKHESTVSRYLSGERTIPIECFANLWIWTRDQRLILLVTKDSPVEILDPHGARGGDNGDIQRVRPLRIPPISQCLDLAIDDAEAAVKILRHLRNVLRDGQLNRVDVPDLRKAAGLVAQSQHNQALLQAALQQALERFEEADAREARR